MAFIYGSSHSFSGEIKEPLLSKPYHLNCWAISRLLLNSNQGPSFMQTKTSTLLPWLMWGVAAVFVWYQFLLQTSTSVMVPDLMRDFATSTTSIGFLSACFFYTYVTLQVPAGVLVDRLGARRLLTVSILLCALACLVFASAKNIYVASGSRLVMGMATAPAIVCALALAARWFSPYYFALLVGLTEMQGMFGGAVGEALMGNWVEDIGWRHLMFICVGFGLLLALVNFLVVRDGPKDTDYPSASPNREPSSGALFKEVLTCRQAWICGVYSGLVFAIIQAFASLWCVRYLMHVYNISVCHASIASAMMFLGAALGTPTMGWLSDYMGQRRLVMIVGCIFSLLLMLVVLYVPHLPLRAMFALLFILGFFLGVYMLPFAVVKETISEKARGTAMGFVNMMSLALGGPILQPLIGWLLEAQSDGQMANGIPIFSHVNYQWALSLLPVCLALALVVSFFVKETLTRRRYFI